MEANVEANGYPGNEAVAHVFRKLLVVFQFLQEDAGKDDGEGLAPVECWVLFSGGTALYLLWNS